MSMRRTVLAFALLAWCALAQAIECRVVDGDSLVCGVERIRLRDVYAEEYKQAGGREAKRRMEALVRGKDVTLVRHGQDRHGRTLADVWVEGRKVVQEDIGPRAGNGARPRRPRQEH